MSSQPPTRTAWNDVELPSFAALDADLSVDVAVVGAGLTGITTAYLMAREGIRVALIDRAELAAADTSRTTAHLTYVTDERMHRLAAKFGQQAAGAFWHGGAHAIDTIERVCEETQTDASFVRVPGFLHAPVGGHAGKAPDLLRKDALLAAECGFDAQFVDAAPYAQQPAVRFERQARFHPLKYLRGLLPAIQRNKGRIFAHTEFDRVDADGNVVCSNGRRIRCGYLVIATHNPLMGRKSMLGAAMFQTRLSLYTSYVLGACVPANTMPDALFWDTQDPYEYLRIQMRDDQQYVIFGGMDVKTGQEDDTGSVFRRLAMRLHEVLPAARIEERWMGQLVETDDGMPFIGENEQKQFIATGFCGNGFTLGTLAAIMARDCYLGRKNPWTTLFSPARSAFHGGTWRYLRENLDYPYYLIRDRLKVTHMELLDVPAGEGRIIEHGGRKAAAYRDANGGVTLLSAACTHMKCLVRWNVADRTWDCPCHGSRFHPTGEVLSGPAEQPLERLKPQDG